MVAQRGFAANWAVICYEAFSFCITVSLKHNFSNAGERHAKVYRKIPRSD